MNTVLAASGLLRACHPGPTAAVTAGAAGLAAAAGHDVVGVMAVAATVGSSQLAIGWHNDWMDRQRDAAANRLDKPIARGDVPPRAVAVAAGCAAVATASLALLLGPLAASVGILGLLSGLAYNWPLKLTILSWLPYAVAFAVLPTFVVLGLPRAPSPAWWLITAGATLGIGAHFANVLGDLDDDARTGVRGLPHRLGLGWSSIVAAALLAATSVLLITGPENPMPVWAIVGAAGSVAILITGIYSQWRTPTSRAAFRAVIAAALIDVAILFAATASF